MTSEEASFGQLDKLYQKYFSLCSVGTNIETKLGIVALTCFLTNALKKKHPNITCYDVLLKVGFDFDKKTKETFLKSLAVICKDFMYGCDEFTTFGVKPADMSKTLKSLLDKYIPF